MKLKMCPKLAVLTVPRYRYRHRYHRLEIEKMSVLTFFEKCASALYVELAARYHGIHQALAGYREQYVAIHRRVHGTTASSAAAFHTRSAPAVRVAAPLPKLSGPSPFSAPRYGRYLPTGVKKFLPTYVVEPGILTEPLPPGSSTFQFVIFLRPLKNVFFYLDLHPGPDPFCKRILYPDP